MIDIVLGLLGAFIGVACFLAGVHVGDGKKHDAVMQQVTDFEAEEVMKERKRVQEDNEAFLSMMNYSTEIAYGAPTKPKE